MSGKMLTNNSVIKLLAVVGLKSDQGELELCQYVSVELQ
jgi:hypothetical protein